MTALEPAPPISTRNPAPPAGVDAVLGRALLKDSRKRFASCGAFVSRLESALSPIRREGFPLPLLAIGASIPGGSPVAEACSWAGAAVREGLRQLVQRFSTPVRRFRIRGAIAGTKVL